jgi:drug/metabolite transporter (DMT)-like permease
VQVRGARAGRRQGRGGGELHRDDRGPARRIAGGALLVGSSIWLPATLSAGLFQALRTAIQQRLRAQLSVNGAGLVRYVYGAPVALLLWLAYAQATGGVLPPLPAHFFGFALLGGLLQIGGTNLLIMAFGERSFVVGTAYAKTEAVQGAVFALWLLGEVLTPLVVLGIAISVAGVILLSLGGRAPRDFLRALGQPAARYGLAAGTLFALTSVAIKRATNSLEGDDVILRALTTLVVVMVLQMLVQGAYVALREPGQWRRVLSGWRSAAPVGVLAACGSACWFTAFASAPVALVRTVGQVEVVFTLLLGRFFLRERLARSEALGLGLVVAGVLCSVAAA